MADRLIRVGRVSKIDLETGLVSITYPDLDDSVTTPLTLLSFNDETKIPRIGEEVFTLHYPTGQARGIILGHYWNKTNKPVKYGEKIYRKEFGHEKGDAWAEYNDDDKVLIFHANEIKFENNSGSITLSELIQLKERVAALEEGGS